MPANYAGQFADLTYSQDCWARGYGPRKRLFDLRRRVVVPNQPILRPLDQRPQSVRLATGALDDL
jgi:hypothetical protein